MTLKMVIVLHLPIVDKQTRIVQAHCHTSLGPPSRRRPLRCSWEGNMDTT